MKYFEDTSLFGIIRVLFGIMQKVAGQAEELQATEQLGNEMASEIQCQENTQWEEKQ